MYVLRINLVFQYFMASYFRWVYRVENIYVIYKKYFIQTHPWQ